MHIVDGVLSLPVIATGLAATSAGILVGLKKIDTDQLPKAAMMSTVFFVASLIHIPFGVTSVHFIANGLIGLMLGWGAFPVLFVALMLQAVFFGFGGVLVLGVNTLNTALPAVIVYSVFRPYINQASPRMVYLLGASAGALAIILSAVMVALSLALSGQAFITGAKIALIAHLPLMVVEGGLTGAAVSLILKVKPDCFQVMYKKRVIIS